MKPAPAKSPKDSINFRLGERKPLYMEMCRKLKCGPSELARLIVDHWMDGEFFEVNIRKERAK